MNIIFFLLQKHSYYIQSKYHKVSRPLLQLYITVNSIYELLCYFYCYNVLHWMKPIYFIPVNCIIYFESTWRHCYHLCHEISLQSFSFSSISMFSQQNMSCRFISLDVAASWDFFKCSKAYNLDHKIEIRCAISFCIETIKIKEE